MSKVSVLVGHGMPVVGAVVEEELLGDHAPLADRGHSLGDGSATHVVAIAGTAIESRIAAIVTMTMSSIREKPP